MSEAREVHPDLLLSAAKLPTLVADQASIGGASRATRVVGALTFLECRATAHRL